MVSAGSVARAFFICRPTKGSAARRSGRPLDALFGDGSRTNLGSIAGSEVEHRAKPDREPRHDERVGARSTGSKRATTTCPQRQVSAGGVTDDHHVLEIECD